MTPDRAQLFTKGADSTLWLLVYAALAIALMVMDRRFQYLEEFRSRTLSAVQPLWSVVEWPVKTYQSGQLYWADRKGLEAENARLQQANLALTLQQQTLQHQLKSYQQIQTLLAAQNEHIQAAQIVSLRSIDVGKAYRFAIDRGREDGIVIGSVLLDQQGVVGQVIQISAKQSIALTISDAKHRIPVYVVRNGVRLYAQGDDSSEHLVIDPLTMTADVKVGDLLLSSGLGGVFPAGLTVGTIAEIKLEAGSGFAHALVKPAADLSFKSDFLLALAPVARFGPKPDVTAPVSAPAPASAPVSQAHSDR